MVEFQRGNVSFISLLTLILVIKFVNGQFINGLSHSGSSEIEIGNQSALFSSYRQCKHIFTGDIESSEIYSVAENAFNKRQHNSQNRFKSLFLVEYAWSWYKPFLLICTDMMINKDNADMISDDYITSKDGPISFYIPRTAPMNGKKRGAILSWALPSSRMFVHLQSSDTRIFNNFNCYRRVGNSNYRQPSNFGIPNSRPAAKWSLWK